MPEEVQRIVFVTHPVWPAIIPRYPVEGSRKLTFTKTKNGGIVNIPPEGQRANRQRRTPHEVQNFLENEMLFALRKIKGNFIIIFVPTKRYYLSSPRITPSTMRAFSEKYGFGNPANHSIAKRKEFNKFVKHRLSSFFRVGPSAQRKAEGLENAFYATIKKEFAGKVFCVQGTKGTDSFSVAREVFKGLNERGIQISKKAVVVGMGAWAEYCVKAYSQEFAKLKNLRSTVSRRGSISIKPVVRPPRKYSSKKRR